MAHAQTGEHAGLKDSGSGEHAVAHTTTIPITPEERRREAALRQQFMRFWTEASGAPRDIYDAFISATPMASGIACRSVQDAAVRGWWIQPADGAMARMHPGAAILFIHGGGYVQGSAQAYRGFASQLVARTGVPALVIDYPLAPEASLPAAPSAALAAWRWLLAQGNERIAIVGDSAGGGLALSTLIQLTSGSGEIASACVATGREPLGSLEPRGPRATRGGPRPLAGVAFSPWTDLAFTGASMTDETVQDPLIGHEYLRDCARKYLGGADPRDPLASPLYGDLENLPPLLIQVGSDERLLDDSRQFTERAAAAGVRVELEIWQGMHHVFQLDVAHLESSRAALTNAGTFLRAAFAA